jgi:hypothetical protein
LVGKNYLGEVRLSVEDLLNGFPYDQWYPLTNKAGKVQRGRDFPFFLF